MWKLCVCINPRLRFKNLIWHKALFPVVSLQHHHFFNWNVQSSLYLRSSAASLFLSNSIILRQWVTACFLLQGSRNSSRSSSPSVRMMPTDKTGSRGYFSPEDPTGDDDCVSTEACPREKHHPKTQCVRSVVHELFWNSKQTTCLEKQLVHWNYTENVLGWDLPQVKKKKS